ncbi:hypothetical protein TWF788_000520 [Orbilia oligospora]|uniref:Exocyst complex component Sec8 n=1 Tax=Orbilia oligospora TaxID=2813651 RepID=A0A7C8PFY6_ORBOL|nr:hypothetical protein TWF788_000520 [Orbilia oligospora]
MATLQNGLPERDPRRGRDIQQRGGPPAPNGGAYPSGPRRQPPPPAGYDGPRIDTTRRGAYGDGQLEPPLTPRGYGSMSGQGGSGGGGGGGGGGRSYEYADVSNTGRRPSEAPKDRSKSRRRGEPAYQDMNGSAEGVARLAGLADVLETIRRDWDFMTKEECIPVQIALQLNDPSSLGKANRLRDFRVIKKNLEGALQAVVNEYHQGFNSSIGTYHSIMRHIGTSAAKVQDLKQRVSSAKKDLTSEKPEVKNLAVESQIYESMLQTLSQIEHLRDVPEKLDLRMGEKRFLTAVDILMEGLKNSNKPDLKGIGALQDLRRGLLNQETSLAEILVEELHSHLYLKSPYCDGRWKSYSNQKDNKTSDQLLGGGVIPQATVTKRALDIFLETEDLTKEMVEDASKNIEAESLHYIRLLIESLHKLGRLPAALEQISQRLPVELNKVVEKTNLEVDSRHPASFRGLSNLKDGKAIDAVLSEKDERVEVLNDLLYTLFSKFEAILEGHRVVHDVVKAISKRDWSKDNTTTLSGGFMEIWKLLQSETRSLLHDYITANESRAANSNAPKAAQNSVNTILAANSASQKKRRMFKFGGPENSDALIKANQDDLEAILKANVPGLVQDSAVPVIREAEETQISDGSATGRKLLVESTVFNMGHLLSPSLQFLKNVKDIIPPGLGVAPSTFTSFLDDFLVNVFLPQLEDTLRELAAQTTGELDAFRQDTQWKNVAQRPVMKGTSGFLSLVTAICRMLDSLPHDQSFSQLIVDLLTDYYEKCHAFFRTLVQKDPNTLKKSALWVVPGELESTMREMWADPTAFHDFLNKETLVYSKLKGTEGVSFEDIISDRKTIYTLCILYNSMDWFSRKLKKLRQVTDIEDPSKDEGTRNRRWNNLNSQLARDSASPVFLPLTKDLAEAFDGVVNTYSELTNTILFTLRAEARTHAAHYIDLAVEKTSWVLENEAPEADPQILTLNTELVWFDQDVTSLLRFEEQRFIKAGLGVYLDHLLIRSCGKIKQMNRKGVDKMLLNILVLQQNLRNLVLEDGVVGDGRDEQNKQVVALKRSDDFWKFFNTGPEDVLQRAKDKTLPYTYDEMKDLVTLWYSETFKTGNRRESTIAARRSLNDHLIQLSELMWEN